MKAWKGMNICFICGVEAKLFVFSWPIQKDGELK